MAELVDALASGASNLTVVEVRVFFRALQVFLAPPPLKAQYHYECANARVVFSMHQSFARRDLYMVRAPDVYGKCVFGDLL